MKLNLKNKIAAKQYDVVSFFDKKPKKGSGHYTTNYGGGKFLFSSLENQQSFEANPEKYIPQYGGFCAIAMSEDKEVDPNPKSWELREGKLYFFTRTLFGIIDVKRQWVKDPIAKRALADKAWEKRK